MVLNRRFGVFSTLLVLLITTLSFSVKGDVIDSRFRSQNLSLLIKGTSTLHDWEIKSDQGHIDAALVLAANDKLTGLSGLTFSVPTESLKSEYKMMDNNTYKALKSSTTKTIDFALSSANVTQVDATSYVIKCTGKLSIAGTVRQTDLVANCKYNAGDKSFTVSGTKNLNMTEYNVKPPTVMMGTIKTGDAVAVSFQTKIIR